jgi:hypothetical protein
MFVEGNGQVIHQKIIAFISKNLNAWGVQVHPDMP